MNELNGHCVWLTELKLPIQSLCANCPLENDCTNLAWAAPLNWTYLENTWHLSRKYWTDVTIFTCTAPLCANTKLIIWKIMSCNYTIMCKHNTQSRLHYIHGRHESVQNTQFPAIIHRSQYTNHWQTPSCHIQITIHKTLAAIHKNLSIHKSQYTKTSFSSSSHCSGNKNKKAIVPLTNTTKMYIL